MSLIEKGKVADPYIAVINKQCLKEHKALQGDLVPDIGKISLQISGVQMWV